ncbi:hypothetical protein BC332_22192 [Capsicum chinense]|nr:hypothetical protein BC332_22192 [Capsicum chinense]
MEKMKQKRALRRRMESEKKVESKILWRNKEEVEGQLKLEAEGDDGFNDFASSLGFVVGASFVTFLYKVIKARICIRHDSIGWSSSIHKSGCTDEVNCCVVGDLFFYEGSAKKRYLQESAISVLLELIDKPQQAFHCGTSVLTFQLLEVRGLCSSTLGTEMKFFEVEDKFRLPKSSISSALSNGRGAYFVRFLTTLWNLPSVSTFRSLSCDGKEAFSKLQESEPPNSSNCWIIIIHVLFWCEESDSTLPGDFSEVASELVICCMRTPQSADFPAASGEDEADGELLVHMLLDHYNLTTDSNGSSDNIYSYGTIQICGTVAPMCTSYLPSCPGELFHCHSPLLHMSLFIFGIIWKLGNIGECCAQTFSQLQAHQECAKQQNSELPSLYLDSITRG